MFSGEATLLRQPAPPTLDGQHVCRMPNLVQHSVTEPEHRPGIAGEAESDECAVGEHVRKRPLEAVHQQGRGT
jgi:hypothetical protein